MKPNTNILWLDCVGGLVVGIIVLVFCKVLSNWEGLPLSVVAFMAIMNLVYGAFSLFITLRKPRPIILVRILAIANMAWLLVCIAIVATWFNQLTLLGWIHVLGEGLYVATLGWVEWKWRDRIGTTRE